MGTLVAVRSGVGPAVGLFYMEPPYTDEQLREHAANRAKRWMDHKVAGGYRLMSAPKMHGPFAFRHTQRTDLSDERRGHDEFAFVATFERNKPEMLTIDEIEKRRELARRFGLEGAAPVRGEVEAKPASPFVDEMGEYRDPNGLNEQGEPGNVPVPVRTAS